MVLADLAGYSRTNIPAVTEALNGRFNVHHAILAALHLNIIDGPTPAGASRSPHSSPTCNAYRGLVHAPDRGKLPGPRT